MDHEIVERMQNSICKNLEELSELCVMHDITNAYDLMDLICNYKLVVSYLQKQNNGANLRGLHDEILNVLEVE